MIYMHYCKKCDFLHMLSGHRTHCPGCSNELAELKITYLDYYGMKPEERESLAQRCRQPELLEEMTFHYKKHKFSKWYKEGGVRG